MPPRPAAYEDIHELAETILGRSCVPLAVLTQQLVDAGLHLGPKPELHVQTALDRDTTFVETAGGWASALAMLDGTTWCTVITADDAQNDAVDTFSNLLLLGWLSLSADLTLVNSNGVEIGSLDGALDDESISGPPGWLNHLVGKVAAFRLDGTDVSITALASEPPATEALINAIHVGFDREIRQVEERFGQATAEQFPHPHCTVDSLLWEAVVANPDVFRSHTVPTIEVLIDAAGFEYRNITIARAGFPWPELERWHRRNRLRDMYKVPADELLFAEVAVGVGVLVGLGQAHPLGTADEPRLAADAIAQALSTSVSATAVLRELQFDHVSDESLLKLAELTRANLSDPANHPGIEWLAGVALDKLGRAEEAELSFRRGAMAGHPLALLHAARFEADRGNAMGAIELLRESGADLEVEPLVAEVGGYALHRPKAAAGRNDKCPCGSGRKYKVCHAGKETIPLLDRGSWLFAKAMRFLNHHDRELIVDDVETVVAKSSERGYALVKQLADGKMLADIALCEGGVFEDFLAQRSDILPADEAITAAQWALTDRSVFEVVRAGHDDLELRNVRTGDDIVVTNTTPGEQTRPGMYFIGRPLPIDNTWRAYSGFLLLRPQLLDLAIATLDDTNPLAVADLIGLSCAPPRAIGPDGTPMRFDALDDFDEDDDLDEWDDDWDDDDEEDDEPVDMNNPALRSALESIMLKFEARWLDESIPALRGMTPRQAVNDVLGRVELERLLNSFPESDDPGTMNTNRLRAALGL
jgi:hypothetical protein